MSTTVISRGASLLVVASYLCLVALDIVPQRMGGSILVGLLFGLPLIWFPEPFGNLTGYGRTSVGQAPPSNSGSGGQQRPTNNPAPTETGGQVAISSSPIMVNVPPPSSSSGQNPTVANQPPVEAAPTGSVPITGVGLTDNPTATAPQPSSANGQVRRPAISLSEFRAAFRAQEAKRHMNSPGASSTQHKESNSAQRQNAVDRSNGRPSRGQEQPALARILH